SDAHGNGDKDHRGDNHFDQCNKSVAQRFHHFSSRRVKITQQSPDSNGYEDLYIKYLVKFFSFNRKVMIFNNHWYFFSGISEKFSKQRFRRRFFSVKQLQ